MRELRRLWYICMSIIFIDYYNYTGVNDRNIPKCLQKPLFEVVSCFLLIAWVTLILSDGTRARTNTTYVAFMSRVSLVDVLIENAKYQWFTLIRNFSIVDNTDKVLYGISSGPTLLTGRRMIPIGYVKGRLPPVSTHNKWDKVPPLHIRKQNQLKACTCVKLL